MRGWPSTGIARTLCLISSTTWYGLQSIGTGSCVRKSLSARSDPADLPRTGSDDREGSGIAGRYSPARVGAGASGGRANWCNISKGGHRGRYSSVPFPPLRPPTESPLPPAAMKPLFHLPHELLLPKRLARVSATPQSPYLLDPVLLPIHRNLPTSSAEFLPPVRNSPAKTRLNPTLKHADSSFTVFSPRRKISIHN